MTTRVAPPAAGEFAAPYARYVSRVGEEDILEALDRQTSEVNAVLGPLSEERSQYRYAPEKWSVREMLGHIADTEQVMAFRALAISRGETQPLPGFDENAWMVDVPFGGRPLREGLQRFAHSRAANVILLRQLAPEDWLRLGTASGWPVSVRGLAWIMVGHVRHHLAVLAERYGIPA
jgi:DinB family protein